MDCHYHHMDFRHHLYHHMEDPHHHMDFHQHIGLDKNHLHNDHNIRHIYLGHILLVLPSWVVVLVYNHHSSLMDTHYLFLVDNHMILLFLLHFHILLVHKKQQQIPQ